VSSRIFLFFYDDGVVVGMIIFAGFAHSLYADDDAINNTFLAANIARDEIARAACPPTHNVCSAVLTAPHITHRLYMGAGSASECECVILSRIASCAVNVSPWAAQVYAKLAHTPLSFFNKRSPHISVDEIHFEINF